NNKRGAVCTKHLLLN
ncbi:DUF1317 family protein, partial [Escherichia coli]